MKPPREPVDRERAQPTWFVEGHDIFSGQRWDVVREPAGFFFTGNCWGSKDDMEGAGQADLRTTLLRTEFTSARKSKNHLSARNCAHCAATPRAPSTPLTARALDTPPERHKKIIGAKNESWVGLERHRHQKSGRAADLFGFQRANPRFAIPGSAKRRYPAKNQPKRLGPTYPASISIK